MVRRRSSPPPFSDSFKLNIGSVRVGFYSCCWLYRREVGWGVGQSGGGGGRGNERAVFSCVRREEEEEKEEEERYEEEEEGESGEGLTVKCALVLAVAGFTLVSLIF